MGLIISEIIADNLFAVYDRVQSGRAVRGAGAQSAREEMIAQ